MKKILYNVVCKDIIESIKEYGDDFYDDDYINNLQKLYDKKNYEKLSEEIISIFEDTYHHNEEIYNLFGSLYLQSYVFTYNKDFCKFLVKELKKEKSKTFKNISKYISLLVKSDYKQQNLEEIINVLTNEKKEKVKIKYKDNKDNITERIISEIDLNLYYYINKSKINAFCHLKNEERNFILGSILEAEIIK